jgi:hypothetical protein
MSQEYQWRRKFIEVVEEVFRDLHFDPPPMTHDPDASLVMELDVDDTTFEVVHNPRANVSHCLIEARLGPVSSDQPDAVLRKLLAQNLDLAREYRATFAADIKDDTLLYNFPLPLEQARGSTVLQALRDTAVLARDWRLSLSGADATPAGGMHGISSALA